MTLPRFPRCRQELSSPAARRFSEKADNSPLHRKRWPGLTKLLLDFFPGMFGRNLLFGLRRDEVGHKVPFALRFASLYSRRFNLARLLRRGGGGHLFLRLCRHEVSHKAGLFLRDWLRHGFVF